MSKKNIILFVILVVLASAAYVYNGPLKNWQARSGAPKNFLSGIKIDNLTKLGITKAGKETILEKDGSRWKIGGTKDFYANTNEVNSLVDALKVAGTKMLEVVSENKDKKTDFATDDAGGTRMKLIEGDRQAADFIIGKFGNDFSSSYISRPDDNKTYLIKVNLFGNVMVDDWRDKTIFSGDKSEVNKIRFQRPGSEFVVEKNNGQWSITRPRNFVASEDKINPILDIMTAMIAVKIPEQIFKDTGLEKSSMIIQAVGDGIDNTIMVGNESKTDKGMFFAKRANSDNIYLISKEDRDKLDKQIENLK